MKISYNWLKNYLPIQLDVVQVSAMLTAIGLEVEDIITYESLKGGLSGVIVGEVISCQKHPNADKLSLTTVNIGSDTPLKIVCGAPNVAAGQKVMVATVGTTIYPTNAEAITMKKAKIRGEESEGMICAEDELGLGNSHAGIIVLPNETKVGTTAADYFGVYHDQIIEIGLTPNRSDAFNHLGVARELAAFLAVHQPKDLPTTGLNNPYIKEFTNSHTNLPIAVEVLDAERCLRYCGIVLENITIKPSPNWLQNSLKAIGVKPINNIVDITNYVLHECGQPLHAFDADKINGNKVIVKTLTDGTSFITLDEKERKLLATDLMICDAEKPMCMAGVYGGATSGVTNSTNRIFLESAMFQATAIRKTSFYHQLRTDAALHFEKGIDSNNVLQALRRAVNLMIEFADAQIASAIFDSHPTPFERKIIQLNINSVNSKLGIQIENSTIETILTQLGFLLEKKNETTYLVTVPSHKNDISIEADLIEEILRLYGLDKLPIPTTLLAGIPIRAGIKPHAIRNKAADFLAANGFSEMMNNSLSQSKYYSSKDNLVTLLNSINTELDILRNDLLYGGLEAIAHNQNRQNADLKFFEFGKSYAASGTDYFEQMNLCLWMTGKTIDQSWQQKANSTNIYAIKTEINKLLKQIGMVRITIEEFNANNYFSYGLKYFSNKKLIAEVGMVAAQTLKQFDIKNDVAFAKLNWNEIEKLIASTKIKYTELSKFPAVKRDLALLIDESISYQQVEKIAKEQMGQLLKEVNLFDIYRDKKIGENRKSYAISLTLQDDNRTLTDDKIDKAMNKLIAQYELQISAEIRK